MSRAPLRFGSYLPDQVSTPESLAIRAARFDERGIYEVLAIRAQDDGFDPWVAATQVFSVTARSRVILDGLPCTRELAGPAASATLLSDGRFELGVTVSTDADEARRSVLALRGAIESRWPDPAPGFLAAPAPVAPHTPIWVIGEHDGALAAAVHTGHWAVETAGRTSADLSRAANRLDAVADRAGVDPATIVRRLAVSGRLSRDSEGFLHGPPQQWADELAALVIDHGYSVLAIEPERADRYGMMPFAAQIRPAVRRMVGDRAGGDEAPAHAPRERSGDWGHAGDLPVADRPVAPPISRRRFTPLGMHNANWLRSVHDHLREELLKIQHLAASVVAGSVDVVTARGRVHDTVLARAARERDQLGSFCAMYSRELEGHHTSEDAALFPSLLRAEPRLGPVVGRLHAEHVVIAGLLQELDEALVTLMGAPEGDAVSAERIQAIAEVLSDLLLSHLGYEEDQLADGLRLLSEAT